MKIFCYLAKFDFLAFKWIHCIGHLFYFWATYLDPRKHISLHLLNIKKFPFNILQTSRKHFASNHRNSFISNCIYDWKIVWLFGRYVELLYWHIRSLNSNVLKFVSYFFVTFFHPFLLRENDNFAHGWLFQPSSWAV